MTNYSVGHAAEQRAAHYLKTEGYKIIELNWKTKYCEIDIIAEKDKTVYFVEVKYRRNDKQGYGLDYITSKKLRQMEFAAEMWVSNHNWQTDYCMAAMGIDDQEVTFVEL